MKKSAAEKIRAAVVDDHPIFRDGVVFILKSAGQFDVVASGGSMADALRIAADHSPDIMLLDVSMPGGGIVAATEIGRDHPSIKIVMLTASEREIDVTSSLQTGVKGYLLKGMSGPEFVKVVASIFEGESYVSPALAARLLAQAPPPANERSEQKASLTGREREILEQVELGLTNKEIARKLSVSEKTVKHYMTNIMSKLQVRNRVEAVLLSRQRRVQ